MKPFGLGKCENCKRFIYESDGGDGNPAIYYSKGHWDGHAPPDTDTQEHNDTWDNCPDYIEKQQPKRDK